MNRKNSIAGAFTGYTSYYIIKGDDEILQGVARKGHGTYAAGRGLTVMGYHKARGVLKALNKHAGTFTMEKL